MTVEELRDALYKADNHARVMICVPAEHTMKSMSGYDIGEISNTINLINGNEIVTIIAMGAKA